jgi:3-dehydroquinate dehydratase-2
MLTLLCPRDLRSISGAYTHTSIAIRDALLGVNIPFIELHISNPHSREEFRHKSFLSDKAVAVMVGLGTKGYGVLAYAFVLYDAYSVLEYAIMHLCTQFKKVQQ